VLKDFVMAFCLSSVVRRSNLSTISPFYFSLITQRILTKHRKTDHKTDIYRESCMPRHNEL
jgi:hypothetical protein